MISFLLKREIKKQLLRSSAKRSRRWYDFREITALTVLAESSQLDDLRSVMQELISEGIRTTIVVSNVSQIDISDEYPVVSVIDIRPGDMILKKHFPNKETIKRFIALKTSVLCDLSVHPVSSLLFLTSISRASMKLGIKKTDLPLYDFMIQPVGNYSGSELAKKLFFYWKSIDIKNNNS